MSHQKSPISPMLPYVFITVVINSRIYIYIYYSRIKIGLATFGIGGIIAVMVVVALIPLYTKSPTTASFITGTVDQIRYYK
jgi:hypothetical protein